VCFPSPLQQLPPGQAHGLLTVAWIVQRQAVQDPGGETEEDRRQVTSRQRHPSSIGRTNTGKNAEKDHRNRKRTYASIHRHRHRHRHRHTQVTQNVCVCIFVCIHLYGRMRKYSIYAHVCLYDSVYMCMYVYTQYICVCVRMYVYVQTYHEHVCIYMCVHT
jgi:hypothetical protein